MTEQEKIQKAKKLSAALYFCFNNIEEAEKQKKEWLERMKELTTEFEQLDEEWYIKFRDTFHPYKDPDWDVAIMEQEYKELKKKLEQQESNNGQQNN